MQQWHSPSSKLPLLNWIKSMAQHYIHIQPSRNDICFFLEHISTIYLLPVRTVSMLARNGPLNYRICLLTNLCRVVALHAVFVAHCFLDAVYLLLVAALVFHCPFLGFLQCTLQGLNSLSRSPKTFLQFRKLTTQICIVTNQLGPKLTRKGKKSNGGEVDEVGTTPSPKIWNIRLQSQDGSALLSHILPFLEKHTVSANSTQSDLPGNLTPQKRDFFFLEGNYYIASYLLAS